ncbi:MAG: P-loop containing nucleoside triphosphate hydrolase protein [Piptocephalis tieghemiana]|nr:MAG: P-loop containing nucleoside triphosphate hydrolase protein [Piptocephalis tieghemiana]
MLRLASSSGLSRRGPLHASLVWRTAVPVRGALLGSLSSSLGARHVSIMEKAYRRAGLSPSSRPAACPTTTTTTTTLPPSRPKPSAKKRKKRTLVSVEEARERVLKQLDSLERDDQGFQGLVDPGTSVPPPSQAIPTSLSTTSSSRSSSDGKVTIQSVDAFQLKRSMTELRESEDQQVEQPQDARLLKVAVLGPANAGKSTLVNRIVGELVSVVSERAHTTRDRVLGIYTKENTQVIFLDTPGVPKGKGRLDRTLLTAPWRAVHEADLVLLVVDSYMALTRRHQARDLMLRHLRSHPKLPPVVLILNKVDLISDPDRLLPPIEDHYKALCPGQIHHTLWMSALKGVNYAAFEALLKDYAVPAPWLYSPDRKTNQTGVERVEEQVRSELFQRLHSYLPYTLRLKTVGWSPQEDGTLWVDLHILVNRQPQRRIVVGSGGSVIQDVRRASEKALTKIFQRHVRLYLRVVVPGKGSHGDV